MFVLWVKGLSSFPPRPKQQLLLLLLLCVGRSVERFFVVFWRVHHFLLGSVVLRPAYTLNRRYLSFGVGSVFLVKGSGGREGGGLRRTPPPPFDPASADPLHLRIRSSKVWSYQMLCSRFGWDGFAVLLCLYFPASFLLWLSLRNDRSSLH